MADGTFSPAWFARPPPSLAYTRPLDESGLFSQNNTMLEKRKNPRYRTLARAIIPGILEGENFLKDISITGGCVECTTFVDIPLDSQVQLEIEPESAARIGNFQLVIEGKWTRAGGYSNEIGFRIVASPKGRQFQRYVDYLAYRSALT